MFLNIYNLGGGVKYSGVSYKIPSYIRRKIYNQTFKIYDIGGLMLNLFTENSFIREYNKKGELFNIGYLKDGKIQKEYRKIIDEEDELDSIVENRNSESNNQSNEETIEERNEETIEESNELYQDIQFSLENLNVSRDTTNVLQLLSGIFSQSGFTINYDNFINTITLSNNDSDNNSETDSSISSEYDEYEDEYEGEVINDIPNGKGIFYEKENTPQYIGYWFDGKRSGKGIYYKDNEKIYYGEWKDNKRVGFGISYSNGKKIFEGIWKNDFPYSGKIYSIEEETIYQGFFSEYNGKFIYYNINFEETYDGTFKNGKRNGFGIIIDSDNDIIYQGQWKKNQKNGYGEENLEHKKYKGYWKDDRYDGYGIIYEPSINDDEIFIKEYSGYWKNGQRNGDGITFYDNGNISFEGEFKNDERYKGIQYYENGDLMYGGYFNVDKFEGEGILYYPYSQEISFEGIFKEGKPLNGISYKEDGTEESKTKIIDGDYYTFGRTFYEYGYEEYEGYFKNGIYHGEGILKNPEKIYKGIFINGFYWNEKDTLQYIDFDTNPIIFKGSLKNDIYFTGVEYIYERNDLNYILYENGPLSYKKWRDGEPIDEEKERLELKQEMKILSYLETKQKKKLEKTSKKDYLQFLEKKYNIIKKENLKKKDLVHLIEKEYSSKKNEIIIEEGEFDLFGNEIRNPVEGFDGETYDESSMKYLFERDENMEFKNIPYIYNENNERVPNYPIMSNGKPLNGYIKGENRIYENHGEYIKVNQRIARISH